MTADEREHLSIELCRMWPRKYEDSELEDFCVRLNQYRVDDVLSALNEHKNTKPFAPKVNEILARVRGKEQRDSSEPAARHDNLVQAVRKADPQLSRVASDEEVLLRFWRKQWFRYDDNAQRRRKQIPDRPEAKAMLEMWERQRNGEQKRCVTGCVSSMCANGTDEARARDVAELVFTDPATFRAALRDLRGEVEVDPFQTEVACQT